MKRKSKWLLAMICLLLFGHIPRDVQTIVFESLAITFDFIAGSSSPFSDVSGILNNNQMIRGDFDNDGDQDLLIIPADQSTYSQYWRNNGNQKFSKISGNNSPFRNLPNQSPIYINTDYAFVADWDNDGDDDIFVTKRTNANENKFYRNDNGVFVELSGSSSPFSNISIYNDNYLIYGDFDNDGDIDLAATPDKNTTAHDYWRNKGNGTFEKVTGNGNPFNAISDKAAFYIHPRYAKVKDWDNDGDLDIFVTKKYSDAQNIFYRNDNGLFTELSGNSSPFKNIVIEGNEQFIYGDFDSDGDIDIDASPNSQSNNVYWQNNGNGTFTELASTASPFKSMTKNASFTNSVRSVLVADWDNDGDDDIYVAKYSNTDFNIFIKQTGSPPVILTKTPAHNAINISVSSNLTLTFNAPVSIVPNKQIQIRRVADNSIVSTIQTNSSAVTGGSTATITINPPADLPNATALYVLIDKGAFTSSDGRVNAGIKNTDDWIFTTNTAPILPTVTTQSASSISLNSATLGGNVTHNGNGVVSERGIVWATTNNPTINNTKIIIGSGVGAFNQNISSLPTGTRIYVRAYAQNEAGVSYGNVIDFYTNTYVESIVLLTSSPTSNSSVEFEITFAHYISGLDDSDFTLTGPAESKIKSVSGAGKRHRIIVDTGNSNGEIRLDFTNPTGIQPNAAAYSSGDRSTIYKQTNPGDRFRTSSSGGSWNANSTWESSADNSFWITATLPPAANAQQVTINDEYELTLSNGLNAAAKNITNLGTIHTGQQSITISETFINAGTLTGNGTIINSSWTNTGIISPGSSPGVLTSDGDLINEGELHFEIGGTASAAYDQLLVNGNFSVGGTLRISLINGYTPSPGDHFQLITSDNLNGVFDEVIIPENEAAYSWELEYKLDGSITLNFNSPLPVKLSYFNIHKEGSTNHLQWQTTEEVNSAYFEIQHKIFANEWASIGRVETRGILQTYTNYLFTHANLDIGTHYYRLKIVDKDGSFSYSVIKSVVVINTDLAVYPNPTSDMIYLPRELVNGTHSFRIMTTTGIAIYSSSVVPTTGIDVRNLPSGLYLIEVSSHASQAKVTFKFLKL